jgi:uncharacterized protein (DUF2235 family)
MGNDAMGKKIVLLSDGTGNSSVNPQKTNVWRLFQALDQRDSGLVAKYDDGVGTSSNKYLALLGGAFGVGLKRNVLDLYKFVCRNYEPNSEIYGFGFSRGAFTIRVLTGLIAREGLVTFRTEEELAHNAAAAYRRYRSKAFPSWSPIVRGMRRLRNGVLRLRDWLMDYPSYAEVQQEMQAAGRVDVRTRFLGLWDTVEAYGIPITELKRGIDWVLWPMMFGDFVLSPKVDRACHALALDEERMTFHPLLWDECAEAEMAKHGQVPAGRITQVWFAGVHSNVGGGYPEDQLSLIPLLWIVNEAKANGLPVDEERMRGIAAESSPYARLYDSRAGLKAYYRYKPRQIPALAHDGTPIRPIVHGSVVMRMARGSDQYAPIILPHELWVAAPDGELLPMTGFPAALRLDVTKKRLAMAALPTHDGETAAERKAALQEAMESLSPPDADTVGLVWDTVWWRRLVYLVTVALTVVLALYPWTSGAFVGSLHWLLVHVPLIGAGLGDFIDRHLAPSDVAAGGFIAPLVDMLSGLIPSYAAPWSDALRQHPIEFGAIAAAILACLGIGWILQDRIHDRARVAWHADLLPRYRDWMQERTAGRQKSRLLAFAVAALLAVVAPPTMVPPAARVEIGIIAGILALVLMWTGAEAAHRRRLPSAPARLQSSLALSIARWIRNNRPLVFLYRATFTVAVPILFALGTVAVALVLANRLVFDADSAAGGVCRSHGGGVKVETATVAGYDTTQPCWASGLYLENGIRYRLTLTTPGDWIDDTIRTDVHGFASNTLALGLGTGLRRWWTQNWFKPIARLGSLGNDEYVLDAVPGSRSSSNQLVAEIKARRDGELFIYVNDAVLMLPGLRDYFYGNNHGTGSLTVERLGN